MPIQRKADNPDAGDNDEYIPYKGSRHDQFDWKLTKVFGTIMSLFRNNYNHESLIGNFR